MSDEFMSEELFGKLLEGSSILRGEAAPSRKFVIEPPDVRAIRTGFELSQSEFAMLLGISVKNTAKLGAGSPFSTGGSAGAITSCFAAPGSRVGCGRYRYPAGLISNDCKKY